MVRRPLDGPPPSGPPVRKCVSPPPDRTRIWALPPSPRLGGFHLLVPALAKSLRLPQRGQRIGLQSVLSSVLNAPNLIPHRR